MLFFKVASSEEEEASVEALKCLGEIGPMNLDSPILQVKVNYFQVDIPGIGYGTFLAGFSTRALLQLLSNDKHCLVSNFEPLDTQFKGII